MRVSEYDAFGPWVYMIDEDHPLPSLFAPCVENPEAYRQLTFYSLFTLWVCSALQNCGNIEP